MMKNTMLMQRDMQNLYMDEAGSGTWADNNNHVNDLIMNNKENWVLGQYFTE